MWPAVVNMVVLLFGSFIAVITSIPVQGDIGNIVQLKLLTTEANTDQRVKRFADSSLSDHLSFGVPVYGENVVLRLKRSRLLPTVTTDLLTTEAIKRASDSSAVFTDLSLGSAFIVKKLHGGYSLEGTFVHANKEWNIQPVISQINIDGKTNKIQHRVFPMNTKNKIISFIGDAVLDSEDRPELINSTLREQNEGKRMLQERNQSMGDHHRYKRAVTQHVVEIAFIVDYMDYAKWKNHVGEDNALPAMTLWYTFVAESMNVRYQTIQDPDISVRIAVTVLKILTNPSDSTFISSLANRNGEINGREGLSAFRSWRPNHPDVPFSDHYMLFTGYDVRGSAGIAVSGRTCTEYGVSICENSFTGSLGGVAAHELGHSLSAIHDSDTSGPGACSGNDQFIMATVFTTPVLAGNEGNPWKFSTCSIKSIKTYLSKVTCTLPENTSSMSELPAPVEGERAGQVFSKNDQCVLAFQDSRSSFCQALQQQNGGDESVCGGMYCSIPSDQLGSCETIVPQEFTPCGTNKWCVKGLCTRTNKSLTSTATPKSIRTTAPSARTLTSTSSTTVAPSSTRANINRRRGIPDLSMCEFLIFQQKGTEWWNCVQKELKRLGHRVWSPDGCAACEI